MKTTLIVIQDEADNADAKKLIEKLMGSSHSQDRARMVAQARLVEAYERAQWPRTAPALQNSCVAFAFCLFACQQGIAPRDQVTYSEVPAKRASWRAQIEGQRVAASGASRSNLSRRVATSSSAEFSNFLSTRVA